MVAIAWVQESLLHRSFAVGTVSSTDAKPEGGDAEDDGGESDGENDIDSWGGGGQSRIGLRSHWHVGRKRP